jgi:uncharacterized membrane protein (UPF0127 family)
MRYLSLAVFLPLALAVLLPLVCCGPQAATVDDFPTRPVTLPGGQVIHVETMIDSFDLTRGLMFRTSLPVDHGMLFVHAQPDRHSYWMYQTLIPLDMIWMDNQHNIVEMAENVQPCKTPAKQCPQYGGTQISSYVLEIPAGMAKKFGLQLSQTIHW